jgi:hypothetical protein
LRRYEVKRARLAVASLGLLLPALAGCDSGSSPPFAVSCSTQRLPSDFIRAYVTVTNQTGSTGSAIIYGPPFEGIRHIYPVSLLRPTRVVVGVAHTSQTYIGFVVYPIAPKKPAHLILRFVAPPHRESIAVTTKPIVQASSWNVLDNRKCVIRG